MFVTFDYSKSNIGATHTPDFFDQISAGIIPISYADWDNAISRATYSVMVKDFDPVTKKSVDKVVTGVAAYKGPLYGLGFEAHFPTDFSIDYAFVKDGAPSTTSKVALSGLLGTVNVLNHFPSAADYIKKTTYASLNILDADLMLWFAAISKWYEAAPSVTFTHASVGGPVAGKMLDIDIKSTSAISFFDLDDLSLADMNVVGTEFNDAVYGTMRNTNFTLKGGSDTFDGTAHALLPYKHSAAFGGAAETYKLSATSLRNIIEGFGTYDLKSSFLTENLRFKNLDKAVFTNGSLDVGPAGNLTLLVDAKHLVKSLEQLLKFLYIENIATSAAIKLAKDFLDIAIAGHYPNDQYAYGKILFTEILMYPVDTAFKSLEKDGAGIPQLPIALTDLKDRIKAAIESTYDIIQKNVPVDSAAELWGEILYGGGGAVTGFLHDVAAKTGLALIIVEHFVSGDGIEAFDDLPAPLAPAVSPMLPDWLPPGRDGVPPTVVDPYGMLNLNGYSQQYLVSLADGGFVFGPNAFQTLAKVNGLTFFDGTLVLNSSTSHPGVLTFALYDGLLGRAPDTLGLEYWADAFTNGFSPTALAAGFLDSPEGKARAGALDNATFVTQLYNATLHRDPEAAGLQFWTDALKAGTSRAEVGVGFALSPEHLANIQPALNAGLFVPDADASAVARIYYTMLSRAPDAAGLKFWTDAIKAGVPLTAETQSFLDSPEAQAKVAGLSTGQYVDLVYTNALGRHAEADGLAFWTGAIDNHLASRVDVTTQIGQSPEAQGHLAPLIEQGWHLA